jgi:hypothetical protein
MKKHQSENWRLPTFSDKIDIDVRCLNSSEKARFAIHLTKVGNAYIRALDGIVDVKVLPYVPKIYIVAVLQKLVSGDSYSWAWNMIGTDIWNIKYFAMFPSLPFIERVHEKHLTMSFIHELTHLFQDHYSSEYEIKELLELRKTSIIDFDEKSHEFSLDLNIFFKEDALSMLEQWDVLSQNQRFWSRIVKNADFIEVRQLIDFHNYLRLKCEHNVGV